MKAVTIGLALMAAQGEADNIFNLISERLVYMEEVAIYKQQHNMPIEDLPQEIKILKVAHEFAEAEGLYPNDVVSFFSAQIRAAKAIQYRFRGDMMNQVYPMYSMDLHSEIRPELMHNGMKFNAALAKFLKDGNTFGTEQFAGFTNIIQSTYLSIYDKAAIFNTLSKIRLDENKGMPNESK